MSDNKDDQGFETDDDASSVDTFTTDVSDLDSEKSVEISEEDENLIESASFGCDFRRRCPECSKATPQELKEAHLEDAMEQPAYQIKMVHRRITKKEGRANFYSHAICIPFCVLGWLQLQEVAITWQHKWVCHIYSFFLTMLFVASSTYHWWHWIKIRSRCRTRVFKVKSTVRFFRFLDKAIIFCFIASSYMPWLILRDKHYGRFTSLGIWLVAASGIIYEISWWYTKYPWFSQFIYLCLGILPGVAVLYSEKNVSESWLIISSGISYGIGVLFFFSNGRIRYDHAIWHLCVNIGTLFQYIALYNQLAHSKAVFDRYK